MSFLGEIKRRKVFQVAAAYAVVAWLLIEIASTIEEPLQLPPWFDTAIIVLVAAGFPITLIISWAYNLTPAGFVRESSPTVVKSAGRKIEYFLLCLVVIAVAWLVYRVEFSATDSAPTPLQSRTNDTQGVTGSAGQVLGSVAVVPFLDLSAAQDQSYFVRGLADVLIRQLGKTDGLFVPNLTSVLKYEAGTHDLQTIGAELRVEAVLNGTLRKQDDRLVISYALTRLADEQVLVADQLPERPIGDLFAIQDEISSDILGTLPQFRAVPFLNQTPIRDAEAYDFYLIGQDTARSRTEADIIAARGFFQEAIDRDEEYAEAYAGVAWTHVLLWEYAYEDPPDSIDEAEAYAEQAYDLNPENQDVLLALSLVRLYQLNWDESIDLATRAVNANAGQAYPRILRSLILRRSLQIDESLAELRRAVTLDPLDPNANRLIGTFLTAFEEFPFEDLMQGVEYLEKALDLNPQNPSIHSQLAHAYFNVGRDADAVATFLSQALPTGYEEALVAAAAEGGYRDVVERFLALETSLADAECPDDSWVVTLLAFLGRVDEAFNCQQRMVSRGYPAFNLHAPWLQSHPGYPELLERLNLADRL